MLCVLERVTRDPQRRLLQRPYGQRDRERFILQFKNNKNNYKLDKSNFKHYIYSRILKYVLLFSVMRILAGVDKRKDPGVNGITPLHSNVSNLSVIERFTQFNSLL